MKNLKSMQEWINDPFNNSIIFIEKSNNEIVASKLIAKRIDIDNQVIAF